MCEHLDPALRALHHGEATPEIFQQIQNIKKISQLLKKIHILIPESLNTSSYIPFISHGVHTHPPPPPHNPPQAILAAVVTIIRNLRNPDLILRKSLQNNSKLPN